MIELLFPIRYKRSVSGFMVWGGASRGVRSTCDKAAEGEGNNKEAEECNLALLPDQEESNELGARLAFKRVELLRTMLCAHLVQLLLDDLRACPSLAQSTPSKQR